MVCEVVGLGRMESGTALAGAISEDSCGKNMVAVLLLLIAGFFPVRTCL